MSGLDRPLPVALEAVSEIVHTAKGRRFAVFLDYDGTLTPIVDRPELAVMSQAMRTTVQTLSRHCLVAIVSGRDRVDIERLVNLESLYFAGSHGFEINGPRASQIHHEIGARYLPALDRAEADLRGELRLTSGALVERKKYSVAVHFRLVRDADLKKVDAAVAGVISGRPELRKRDGKKVYEIQPNIEWDKGKAVLWLLEALHLTKDNSFPLYIGDDLTDEDAFQALKDNGIGVVVGRTARPTAAQYTLNNPDDVARFLEQMAAHLETKSS
ncbi:MAG: trehalose-phosphatase [Nitrospiraceae bacterium]